MDQQPSVSSPMIFSRAHELKHHYLDRGKIQGEQIRCGDYNANEEREITAEISAAELIPSVSDEERTRS